jgi:membrane protease YdiL (CAAX protease family)
MIPALLFAAAHIGNPEWDYDRVWAGAGYVLLASYLGLISLKGGGLEASLGAHLGNNIYGVLIVGSAVSASQGPTLWQAHQIDFRESFFVMIPVLGLHYFLVFCPWTKRRNPRESDCQRC